MLRAQAAHGYSADWELAGLVCQALWNCCADVTTDLALQLDSSDTEGLLTLLADLLGSYSVRHGRNQGASRELMSPPFEVPKYTHPI